MARIPMADVVVLLPGIGGSVLTRNGKDVWAPSASAVLGALSSLGGSLESLELGEDDWLVDDLGDGVAADRLVPDLHTLPGLWKIDGYTAIEKFLLARFDLQKGRNYFRSRTTGVATTGSPPAGSPSRAPPGCGTGARRAATRRPSLS